MRRFVSISATILIAVAGLSACNRMKDGSGVDPMTNKPWTEIDMASPDYNFRLWVQCDDGNTKIGIKSEKHLSDDDGTSVMVRFSGDQTATDETWGTTTSHDGAIRSGDASLFLKQMIASKEVQIRLSPIGSPVVDTSFDLSDFAAKLGQYRDRCGWGNLLNPPDSTPAPPATASAAPVSNASTPADNAATANGASDAAAPPAPEANAPPPNRETIPQ